MRDFIAVMFSFAAGLTASGIVSNLYRLLAKKPESLPSQIAYAAVMVFAGPNVLLENAARARREESCSAIAFWLASAIAGTWSIILGIVVLGVALSV